MNQVNVSKLRKEICGSDKIPRNFTGTFPDTKLVDTLGELVCVTTVHVNSGGIPGCIAKHRVFCSCPNCDKFVPVGRLAQHYKMHEKGGAA